MAPQQGRVVAVEEAFNWLRYENVPATPTCGPQAFTV